MRSWALLWNRESGSIERQYAPKAMGAWNLHCTTVHIPLVGMLLYSSVAAAFGNTGQANYATSNSCLDSFARVSSAHGVAARSMQLPLVSGAGMGAAAGFCESSKQKVQIKGLASISLDEYAGLAGRLLAPTVVAALSVLVSMPADVSLLDSVEGSASIIYSELSALGLSLGVSKQMAWQ